jgi:hypothetical protein
MQLLLSMILCFSSSKTEDYLKEALAKMQKDGSPTKAH